jgi:hypothetical protein
VQRKGRTEEKENPRRRDPSPINLQQRSPRSERGGM